MNPKRPIRSQETELIVYLLGEAGLHPADYSISQEVDEYEGGVMGSIGLGDVDAVYDGDIIQAGYIDADGTNVVITLTKDTKGQLLDLDFWKVDFSKLIKYPSPEEVAVKK